MTKPNCQQLPTSLSERAKFVVQALLEETSPEGQMDFGFPDEGPITPGEIANPSVQRFIDQAERLHGKKVVDFEVRRHGVENCQYWQGASAMHTDYDQVYTGTGSNAHEALNDALDSAAADGWDVREIPNDNNPDANDVNDVIKEHNPDMDEDEIADADFELYYYVTLYVKGRDSE